MANITKPFYSFLLFLFIGINVNSQVLLSANLDLNPGGIVHDIASVPLMDCYVVVGEFTSIGGVATNNIAFVNKGDLSINTGYTNSYGSDGVIKTIEVFIDTTVLPSSIVNNIYIGGGFDNINNIPHGKLALIEVSSLNINLPPLHSLNTWNADIDPSTLGNSIDDLLIIEDTTLIFSGKIENIGVNDWRWRIGAFNTNNYTLTSPFLDNDNFGAGTYISYGGFKHIEYFNNNLIALSSGGDFGTILNDGTFSNAPYFNSSGALATNGYFYFKKISDTLIIASYDLVTSQGDQATFFNPINATEYSSTTVFKHFGYNNYGYYHPPTHALDFEKYKRIGFYVHEQSINEARIKSYNLDEVTFIPYPSTFMPTTDTLDIILDETVYGNSLFSFYGDPINQHLFIVDNKLFFWMNKMTSIGGQSHAGLAAYCLEPMDAESFLFSDSTVCPGQDSVLYTLAPVDYATNFEWEYSGQGAIVRTNGGSTYDTIPPGDSHISDTNSIWIKFGPSTTPGTLTVTPLSACGLPSKSLSLNITSPPLPTISVSIDTTLNCKRDSVILVGSSSTSGTTYQWNPDDVFPIQNDSNIVFIDASYVFQVTDSIGCSNFDTVVVTQDTVMPVAYPIQGISDLTCSLTSLTFNDSTSNILDSLIWKNPINNSYTTNPITISVPGTYTFIAIDKVNGCADSSQSIIVGLNTSPPHIGIQGYPNYTATTYLDTISCTVDTLNLYTESDSINAITNWTSADSTQLNGTYSQITASGTYYIMAIDTVNGCFSYKTVLIDADTAKPLSIILPGSTELSCSLDSIILFGGSSTPNINAFWNGDSIPAWSASPVTVFDTGMYELSIISVLNGCIKKDSVYIDYNPEILVSIGADTVGCDQSNITINSSYVGSTITGLTYNWNNGGTSASSSFVAGTDTIVILALSGDNSCYGTDTLHISIPPVPTASITTFKPCGNGSDGQIVINMTNGWAPFTYSIDNGANFQTNPVFNNVPYGSYDVIARDTLGCDYSYQTAITDTSNLPEPLFLVSTNNFIADTVVLVDVSNPPTDSSSWSFPIGIQVLDNNNLAPIIILPDTGSYDITMTGYYGTCDVSITKTIYSADFDSTYATQNNLNGIKTITLYPNPNNGNFTINVEFFKKQQAVLTIQDISGIPYFYQQYGEVSLITEAISLSNAITGTYILKVVSEYDSSYFTFVITQ